MRVHIILKESVRNDPDAQRSVLRHLVDQTGLSNVNEKRLRRFGIISGDVPPDRVSIILKLDEVEACEPDQRRQAM
jgi:hypothetical protein